MPKLPDLVSGFKMLKEVDLNAVRSQAEAPLYIMVIGEAGSGKTALIEQLMTGPLQDEPSGLPPITIHRPESVLQFPEGALALLLLDARKADHQNEREVFDRLIAAGVPTVVCYNKVDLASGEIVTLNSAIWAGAGTAIITATDRDTLIRELVPSIMRVCKGCDVQLARHLPLLRETVAQKLIVDTCFINATYSLGTGLAELVPVLNLPLNLADIMILTKNQALMAYTITLAMGMKGEWRDTMPKLAAVVGSAFLWRQMARYLTGLIPLIGIAPKVVISYAGTYVIGEAVYQWCANGDKLSAEELKGLYAEALEQGSEAARVLIKKGDVAQHQAAEKFKEIAQVVSEMAVVTQEETSGRLHLAWAFIGEKGHDAGQRIRFLAGKAFKPVAMCPYCGKKAPSGAFFCAYCGKPLDQ
ncbi:MAG: hypothetical protein JXA01_04235 [Dehalococcoidia bacterium]|nr:hypothetical protein [Dehalococcoidia bacterium]